jgi:hypothetical protein
VAGAADLLEFVSCILPPLALSDSGVAFGFVFTSVTGFISVFSFTLSMLVAPDGVGLK